MWLYAKSEEEAVHWVRRGVALICVLDA